MEVINGGTGSDAQKKSGSNCLGLWGQLRFQCREPQEVLHHGEESVRDGYSLTARADGIYASVGNNYCLVTEHAPLDVVKPFMISIQERDESKNIGCRS